MILSTRYVKNLFVAFPWVVTNTGPGGFMVLYMYLSPDNVVCATSKASDQPAHKRSLIRVFASRLNIL